MRESEKNDKIKRSLALHNKMLLSFFISGLWITSIAMASLMVVGIVRIGHGITLLLPLNHKLENLSIITILEGLETIFISPLAYLLMLSFTKYISATRPEINPNLEIKQDFIRHSLHEIKNVKLFLTGLFISLLILHSIKLIIEDSMTLHKSIYISLILLAMITYYFVLDIKEEKPISMPPYDKDRFT